MPEERIYVIPLSEAKRARRYKRTNRAVKTVQQFLAKHLKSEEIKIDEALNRKLWTRGARKPPSKIRVKAIKQDDGSVLALPAE